MQFEIPKAPSASCASSCLGHQHHPLSWWAPRRPWLPLLQRWRFFFFYFSPPSRFFHRLRLPLTCLLLHLSRLAHSLFLHLLHHFYTQARLQVLARVFMHAIWICMNSIVDGAQKVKHCVALETIPHGCHRQRCCHLAGRLHHVQCFHWQP